MRLTSIGLGCVFLGVIIAACSGNTVTSSGSSMGGSSGSIGSNTGGSVLGTCTPACAAPQFCGSTNMCLDPGKCVADADCGPGTICDIPTSTCKPGGGCAGQEIIADPVPPNLLVVLDRSCSMTQVVSGGMNKWQIAVAALNKMTTDYAMKIRFGLTMFPDLVTPNCGQDKIAIPVGPSNEMAIQTMLTSALKAADPYYPDGPCVTNIDTAMQQAQGEPAFMDMTRDSYALLLTDGNQAGCSSAGGDPGTLKIIQDLYTQKVSTFVLGFGSGVDPTQLNLFADAGGVPSGNATKHFYDAADQMSLDAALTTIASKTLSCIFKLQTVPSDPSQVFVFFDKDPKGVFRDPSHTSGWDYDAATNQITFYGTDCASLKGGAVKTVDIVLGCNMPPPT
jgi:hypothetical protein